MPLADTLRRGLTSLATALRPRPVPRVNVGEVGGGFSVTGGIPEIDYLDELGYPEFIEEFKRVANDPQVAKELRAARDPLLSADWQVEPHSDDARDVQIAEFCASNLYQDEDDLYGREFWCRTPWLDRLRDAMRMLQNGFAVFQVLWRQQGRFYVYDKFKYILPETIEFWYFEEGTDDLLRIQRNYTRADGSQVTQEVIEAADLFVYTWNKEGSNILGKPFIREAWKPYKFKVKYEKFGIIDKQRTSIGVPWFKNPAGDSTENIRRGEQVAKAMRGGNLERLYVRHDEGADFGWKEGGQSTKGIPDLIRQQDEQISKVGVAGFMGLGQEGAAGSRGVAGTQASFSERLMTSIVQVVVGYENQLIQRVVDVNFARVASINGNVYRLRGYPKAKASNVDPFEKTRSIPEFVTALATLRSAGGDLDTENEIRRRYGFMEVMALPAKPEPEGAGEDEPDETDEREEDDPQDPDPEGQPTTTLRRRVRLAAEVHVRAKVDPDEIRAALERYEAVYFSALRQVRADMAEAVTGMIATGALRPRSVTEIKVPFQKDLEERLLAIAKSSRDFGREQVQRELDRQLVSLARKSVPNPGTRRGAISYSNRQAEVMVGLDVSNVVSRLQSTVVEQYNLLAGSGLSDAEIAREIDKTLAEISDRQLDAMARQSTALTFNAGRNVAIQEFKPQLESFAIRAEVNDDNTCEPCEALDGRRFMIGTQEYHENMPPAKCEGRHRCRGFYAVFAKGVEVAA